MQISSNFQERDSLFLDPQEPLIEYFERLAYAMTRVESIMPLKAPANLSEEAEDATDKQIIQEFVLHPECPFRNKNVSLASAMHLKLFPPELAHDKCLYYRRLKFAFCSQGDNESNFDVNGLPLFFIEKETSLLAGNYRV